MYNADVKTCTVGITGEMSERGYRITVSQSENSTAHDLINMLMGAISRVIHVADCTPEARRNTVDEVQRSILQILDSYDQQIEAQKRQMN